MEEDKHTRRKLIIGLIPYAINVYAQARTYLNPAAILTQALEAYEKTERQALRQKELLQAILDDWVDLQFTFENGKLCFLLDREMMLELLSKYFKKTLAKEGAAGAILKTLPYDSSEERAFDAELKLPNRSIYVKLSLQDVAPENLSSYMEEARLASPSEFWLLGLKDEDVETKLEPVFLGENRILFGRLRRLGLSTVLRVVLRIDCGISVEQKEEGIKVLLSNRPSTQR